MKKEKMIEFDGAYYSVEILKELSVAEVLDLRNAVAEKTGLAAIKSFKDQEQAVEVTWKALEKFALLSVKKSKPRAVPKLTEPAKCAYAQKVGRPTRAMFRRIQKITEHPGAGFRIRRWGNYQSGMTLLDCIEGDEMTPLDIHYYVDAGLMKLLTPTEEEYQSGMDAWYKKHNLENPVEVRRKLEEEYAKAKAEKEAKKKKAA